MKNMMKVTGLVFIVFSATAFLVNPLKAQKAGEIPRPIPADVMKIAEKSCVNCHTEPGNGMALMHLNLSNWDKYSAEKQAAKAQAMCKMVTKSKMPPKKFKAEHPYGVPTGEEIKTICDWANSLQPFKK